MAAAPAESGPPARSLGTKLIPRSIDPLRIVEIIGLDRQADGGTHVRSTREVGGLRLEGTESK